MSKIAKKDLRFNSSGWIIIKYRDEENELRKAWFDDIEIAWSHVKILNKIGIKDIYVN